MKYDDTPEQADNQHTEITLSNTTLLLIFLGVAIICGVFFGFGYSMGKRSAAPQIAAAELPVPPAKAKSEEPAMPPSVTTETAPVAATPPASSETMSPAPTPAAAPAPAKPSAVAPATTPAVQPAPVVKAPPAAPVTKQPAAVPAPVKAAPPAPVKAPVTTVVAVNKPVAPKPKTKPAAPATASNPPAPAPEAVPTRTYVVQVAAVSRQADAETLMGALRRKGYQVNAYPGSQDTLIHVQVGPFSSQKDALAMKDKLSNDGYLAIVK